MLQKSVSFEAPPPRQETDRRTPGSVTGIACSLVASLRSLGLRPGLLPGESGLTAGGADLQVWPRELGRSGLAAEHFLRRVAALIDGGIPVTLSLRELGPCDSGIQVLEDFCSRLRNSLGADKPRMSKIGLSLRSHQIPLQAYFLISRTLLGSGPRYVILDSLQMQRHKNDRVQEETDRNWSFLWRQRKSEASLIPVYGAGVRTGCPLLGDEAADAILPVHGMQVPAGSAWLPISLHLARFADGNGQINWPLLQTALEGCIDLGDQLLDVLSWPTACQRSDAWLNPAYRRPDRLIAGTGTLGSVSGVVRPLTQTKLATPVASGPCKLGRKTPKLAGHVTVFGAAGGRRRRGGLYRSPAGPGACRCVCVCRPTAPEWLEY
jgi:hypothetical protein